MSKFGSKAGSNLPDDYVPKDNDDLVVQYQAFVTRLVTRYNRVNTNFQDLLQHVWMKLIEVKIIDKYNSSGGSLPKKMTALQAASYLQMTFGQFKVTVWRHLVGDDRDADALRVPVPVRDAVYDRDRGVCHKCGASAVSAESKLNALKVEDPAKWKAKRREMLEKFDISMSRRILWVAEKVPGVKSATVIENYRTTCLCCIHATKVAKTIRKKSKWAPTPIQGGWASKKALYAKEDIERFKMQREDDDRCKKHEIQLILPQTKSLFKLYLARAVHNIYANWCRTRSRRYKEFYPGPNEEGQAWESFLEDKSCLPDDMVVLYQAIKLAASGEEEMRNVDLQGHSNEETEVQICGLLVEGYSMADVIQKLSLSKSVLRALAKG